MKLENFLNKKLLSVGLILTDGDVFLAVQPTGHKGRFDIPKGQVDAGESLKMTLIREIKEEVGIDITRWSNELIDMGKWIYMSHKDVHVYVLILKDLPPASTMKCISTFELYGRWLPEVKNHQYLKFDNLRGFNPGMTRIIRSVYNKIKNEI